MYPQESRHSSTATVHRPRPLPMLVLLAACALLAGQHSLADAQSAGHWSGLAQRIAGHLVQAQQAYGTGDAKAARHAVIAAYFGEFEDSKMEAAMRMQLGAKHTWKVEKRFGALRKAIKADKPADEVAAMVEELRRILARDAARLDEAGIKPAVFEVNQ